MLQLSRILDFAALNTYTPVIPAEHGRFYSLDIVEAAGRAAEKKKADTTAAGSSTKGNNDGDGAEYKMYRAPSVETNQPRWTPVRACACLQGCVFALRLVAAGPVNASAG